MHSSTLLTNVNFQAESGSRQSTSRSAQDEVVVLTDTIVYIVFCTLYLMLTYKLVATAKGMARCMGWWR